MFHKVSGKFGNNIKLCLTPKVLFTGYWIVLYLLPALHYTGGW